MKTAERSLDDYNLFDPAVAESPFEYYAALRARAPVYKTPMGFYLVTSHALCVEAMRDPERFSSKFLAAMGGTIASAMPDDEEQRAELFELAAKTIPPTETLLSNDPPSHRRFRLLVNKAFSPRRVDRMHDYIEEIATELVDRFVARGSVELVSEFASPLPLTVIADQLGVPREHMPEFKKWSDASVGPLGGMMSADQQLECARLVVDLQSYLAERCEERRGNPSDDLLSDLVHAEVEDEEPLTTPELVSIAQQFLVAGNETTTNLISAGTMFLLQNPDQLEKIRADRTLIPNAVEEAVRCETPVSGMWRVVTRDLELGGVPLPKGSFVMLRYAAANRDEQVFEDPERFDVERSNARDHLAFGLGTHYCPGAALARRETVIAFGQLLDRLPNLRLAADNDFAHVPSMLLRGLARLNLEFDAV